MSAAPDWEVEGKSWPNRAASRFVASGPLNWHVQHMGEGPALLLLHGTGAATHSWRGLMPLLAERFTVIAPDLPGHGFTKGRPIGGYGLPAIAAAVRSLLETIEADPALLVGHSAGAAIAARMVLDRDADTPIIGFSPALMPFPGLAAKLFPAMARMLFVNPLVPRIFARIARTPGETERFLKRSTGSAIDAEGLACYRALFGTAGHCGGALAMMAHWDLEALKRDLGSLAAPVLLVHGERDAAIPMSAVHEAADEIPGAAIELLDGLGHLAHEERPELAAEIVLRFAAKTGVREAERTNG